MWKGENKKGNEDAWDCLCLINIDPNNHHVIVKHVPILSGSVNLSPRMKRRRIWDWVVLESQQSKPKAGVLPSRCYGLILKACRIKFFNLAYCRFKFISPEHHFQGATYDCSSYILHLSGFTKTVFLNFKRKKSKSLTKLQARLQSEFQIYTEFLIFVHSSFLVKCKPPSSNA